VSPSQRAYVALPVYLAGCLGVGGGFLVILLLGFFYGMDQQTAQGTVLIMGGAQCRVGIFALSATLRRRSAHGRDHRRVGFDWYPAARLATGLDPHVLRLAFALFLATIAVTVAYHTWRGGARLKQSRCKPGGG